VAGVHLLGRSGVASSADAALLTTTYNGSAITSSKADISLREDLIAVLGSACGGLGGMHLQGILHASGVLADATIANQSLAGIQTVFAPKVLPVEGWEGLLGAQPAALQVLFSSVASMLGAPGQANYSTANAALDSMAQAAQAKVGGAGVF
jgi:NAD(P)-dependent dehydrogenase (short-subunit alcohol dehydrogenase family)